MWACRLLRWGVWSLLLRLGPGGASASGCPPRCACRPEAVVCSGRHLSSAPDGLSGDARRLDLSHNQIRTVGRRQFSGLPRLQELDLSHNAISSVEAEAFQGLPGLRTLRINGNRLKLLPLGAFSGLAALRLLDLSQNQILVFLDFTFRDLSGLQTLQLEDNPLVFVSPRAFAGLLHLQTLQLERSNLTEVPTAALAHLQGLTRLRLLRLAVSTLPGGAFRRLHRLRSLRIADWPALDAVASDSLAGLNLTALAISSCNLSAVPYAALRHLAYLRSLDLSHNPISAIRARLLGGLRRLQELHLAGGRLLRIEPGAFGGLADLRTLNVTSNRLATLEESAFHAAGTLQVLRLDGNPLACDCRLLWLARRRLRLNFDGAPPACSSPAAARRRQFLDFSEEELPALFACRPARVTDRRPQEARVEEGATVAFSCNADGDPPPSITWISAQRSVVAPTGRVRALPDGTLEVRSAQVRDSGTFRCLAGNAAGNDSLTVGLQVRGRPRNRTAPGSWEEGWAEPPSSQAANASARASTPYPFDAKTLVIATTMGFLSFLGSVALCFVFMFFWSQSKGQIKHTATIDFVPRSSMGGGDGADGGRFTMKLI
ncbi:Leucine-rich repeat and immunoglobulin-like domain-containing nogo receptor-interacting protein 1 [Liparis tanakae]|nr:Leucine-rich repeat and immunoglobulin-like domain-containing nogo receptor-interacting protein 1 [Liparis tanakae]